MLGSSFFDQGDAMPFTKTHTIVSKFILIGYFFSPLDAQAAICDFLWGGRNEATAYTAPYLPGMGRPTLANVQSPPMNLGAPNTGIPVQATTTTQPLVVQQSTIPTINVPTGPVGAVGQPATSASTTAALANLPPGAELMYILPPKEIPPELCSQKGTPAIAAQVVPPTTPGAIPVAVRQMTVTKPKVDYEWTYAPIRETTETLVKVVDPKTGRVLRTYCDSTERRSTLPWPHRKEVITYEQVTVQVATPLSPSAVRGLAPQPSTLSAPSPQTSAAPMPYNVSRPIHSFNGLTTTVLAD